MPSTTYYDFLLIEDASLLSFQLVTLTFDDAVTAANYQYIEEVFKGRTNPDGCATAATFFVSHEYTDYSKVHALWTEGHEIALHSIRFVVELFFY